MATDELASKLSRRLQMEGEGGEATEQPGLNGAAAAAAAEAPDETAQALGSADDELSAKLLRRADLNQGIGEPQSPSRRVFNPYTEFKEFRLGCPQDLWAQPFHTPTKSSNMEMGEEYP